MQEFWDLIQQFFTFFQPENIIRYGGLIFLLSVVFIENGLFFGFFLPGDSLMFTAGLLTATGVLNHPFSLVLGGIFSAAVLGSSFGYYFGSKAGRNLYKRKDTFFFRKNHIAIAEQYYQHYGIRTLVIGRFLPVVRTFAPIVAGIVKMPFATFMLANVGGAAAWVGSLVSLGYFLGRVWPDAEHYLGYIIFGLIIITAIPVIRTYLKARAGKNKPSI
ncbi:MAG: DedA family protein [Bacteroidia bacterium]